jgi:hypothetical protein
MFWASRRQRGIMKHGVPVRQGTIMGLGLLLRGRSRRLGRDPAAALTQVGDWAREQCAGTLRAARLGQDDDGRPYLALSLHPAAEPVHVRYSPAGHLDVEAKTSTVGPGYHRYLCAALHLLGAEFNVIWQPPDLGGEFGDETGYFRTGDWEDLQRQMLDWLSAVARLLTANDGEQIRLNLPVNVLYEFDGPILTPLGPRSLDWALRTVADARAGVDLFPWWNALQDAQYHLNLALCLMWTELRWRRPFDEQERQLLEEVNRRLHRAYEQDADLAYPWREWQELLRYLDTDSPHLPAIVRNAELAPEGPKAGYRRGAVLCRLPGGWTVQVPGSFAECWDDEQAAWLAHDEARHIYITTYTLTEKDGRPRPADELLETAQDLGDDYGGGEVLNWRSGPLRGKATLRWQADGDEPHWVLSATSVVPGRLAVCTISFEKEADRDWAIAAWHSLRQQEPPPIETLSAQDFPPEGCPPEGET